MSVEEIARKTVIELRDSERRKIGIITSELPHLKIMNDFEVDSPSNIIQLGFLNLDNKIKGGLDTIQITQPNKEISRKGYFAIKSSEDEFLGILLYETAQNKGPQAGLITYFRIDDSTDPNSEGPFILAHEDVFINGKYVHSHVPCPLLQVNQYSIDDQSEIGKILRGMALIEMIAFPDGFAPVEHQKKGYKLPPDIKKALRDANGYEPQIEQLVGKHL